MFGAMSKKEIAVPLGTPKVFNYLGTISLVEKQYPHFGFSTI